MTKRSILLSSQIIVLLSMLRDHEFESSYDTNFDDDVVSNFYEPALSESISYKRMAGFFRSSSFALISKGLAKFIEHEGLMEIVACPYFSDEDLKMINSLSDNSDFESVIVKNLSKQLTPEIIEEEHVEAMGWMLANGLLKIRIVLVKSDDGNICSEDLFHNKVGILFDGTNTVVFSGSINESASGWGSNIEEFDVFCDWLDPIDRIEKKKSNFDQYWSLGESKRKKTIELPDAVKEHWIKSVPKNKESLKIFKKKCNTGIQLRNYQNEAIQNWFDNGCIGIFNMATGTGKTITAIYALKRLLSEIKEKIVIIVAVPLQHLIEDPWIKTLTTEIKERKLSIVRAFNSSKIWLKEANSAKVNYTFGISDNITLVTTYDTLSSDNFISFVKTVKGKKILIADEVHNSGSDRYRDGLLTDYSYRLGLSATPARYLDDDGTAYIQEYFSKEVYTFTLQRAITEINPDTKQTYLTPYNYYPIFVNINDKELSDYQYYNGKLAKFVNRDDINPNELNYIHSLLINRSRIIKNAASKIETLSNMIPKLKNEGFLKYCLIYCSDGKDPDDITIKSRERVVMELNRNDVPCRRFTAEEKIIDRQEILSDFASGETNVIVAIKCLDEGVDVPATKNAIIMASTGNPREYIQRRGRVLRRYKDKEYANIFDFVVVPRKDTTDYLTERQIFISEYKRFKEFSDYSLNKTDNEKIIADLVNELNINLDEGE